MNRLAPLAGVPGGCATGRRSHGDTTFLRENGFVRPPNIRLSKFLSLVLRHHPEQIDLLLDGGGWADVDELLEKSNLAGVPLTNSILIEVVTESEKRRFAFNVDGSRIRANHGHSIPVDLDLIRTSPPETLYHGTAVHLLDSIRREGLVPGSRNFVHLSEEADTARAVGTRHGRPIVLRIATAEMEHDGCAFYRSESGVWLTPTVSPPYLRIPYGH